MEKAETLHVAVDIRHHCAAIEAHGYCPGCRVIQGMLRAHAEEAVKAATEELQRDVEQLARRCDGLQDAVETQCEAREKAEIAYDHMSHMWECEFLAARETEQSEADARSYVAEVAHGITHYAGCDALTPCTRCERDAALAEVEAAKQAIAIREDSIQTLGEKFVEVAEERDALRKRVGKLEAATKQGPFGSEAQPKVADRCPACGHTSLFIGSGGWLTCGWLGCREPGVGRAFESRVEQARREGAGEVDSQAVNFAMDPGLAHVLSTLARIIRAGALPIDRPKADRPMTRCEVEVTLASSGGLSVMSGPCRNPMPCPKHYK